VRGIVPNSVKVTSISDIGENDRLFYELGTYTYTYKGRWRGWTLSGEFKEIRDVRNMLIHDTRLNDIEYINHHNFCIIKHKENENI
jgi:hypothetical protein